MSSKRKLLSKFGDKPVMVCIALLFVMAMMTGFTTSRHVTIAVDGRTIDMNTTYRTPTTILRQAGVNMNVQDEYHMTEDRDRPISLFIVQCLLLLSIRERNRQ